MKIIVNTFYHENNPQHAHIYLYAAILLNEIQNCYPYGLPTVILPRILKDSRSTCEASKKISINTFKSTYRNN